MKTDPKGSLEGHVPTVVRLSGSCPETVLLQVVLWSFLFYTPSLQGNLNINSKIGEGTSIILTFPVCSA